MKECEPGKLRNEKQFLGMDVWKNSKVHAFLVFLLVK
jgi:hypothetical protein